MHPVSTKSGRHILGGTIQLFLAEALLLPTGLLTAIFLTRQFGIEGYGLYTLVATLIAWVQWSITSVFTRATIKFVGEADDWRPVGATVLWLHLVVSSIAMLLVWLFASPVARTLGEPAIATYLRLFALDIPVFCLAYAHRSILVGVGSFSQRAVATAGRWLARLLLIVVLVEIGLSVPGAILGNVGASLVELAICRFYIRPSLWAKSSFPMRQLWGYALPLFLFALSMRLYEKLDLLALKILGGTATQAGLYGAAQNLSLIPSIFAVSFSPLLLSTLSRTLSTGDRDLAKSISCNAMRAVVVMLPLAAMTSGASPEIISLLFGTKFMPSAPLLSLLIFGTLALAMISVTTAILTAGGKPNWTFALTAPLVPIASIGYLLLIPRLGHIGASLVFALFAIAGSLVTVMAVYCLWQVLPPATTLCRSTLISGLTYALAIYWYTPGWFLLLKLLLTGLLVPVAFLLLGELSTNEIVFVRSLVLSNTVQKYKQSKPH